MDEAQVFQQAAMNLQSRCVTSKHMRHDGAMSQAAPEVWSKATSLRAAKAELCSKYKEPEDDFRSLDMDTMGCAVKSMSLSASSGVFKKSAKRSSTGKEEFAHVLHDKLVPRWCEGRVRRGVRRGVRRCPSSPVLPRKGQGEGQGCLHTDAGTGCIHGCDAGCGAGSVDARVYASEDACEERTGGGCHFARAGCSHWTEIRLPQGGRLSMSIALGKSDACMSRGTDSEPSLRL